jgi:hypothetical protein
MSLLQRIKDAGQDFEWYPTTDEMLRVVADSINSTVWSVPHHLREVLDGILDIGAGDGRALRYFRDHCECARKLMAVEKSSILTQEWPGDVFPVGCDFTLQSLMDKPVRAIFCNPPYGEYAQWTCKIIREGFFFSAYLVIPRRWKENRDIVDAIAERGLKVEVLWSGDFLDAERSARAIVDIVRLHHGSSKYDQASETDPFAAWFASQFQFSEGPSFDEHEGQTLRDKAMVSGRNLVEALEILYHDELSRLCDSYKAITALDVQTLKDIGVERDAIRAALKEKIKGLKNKYWHEVFNNLDKVTSRLTSKSREDMLKTLMSSTHVDFDASNVYTVLIWVVKNANKYFDSQLVELFKSLACKKSAIPYKSNIHWQDGSWRSMTGWDIHNGKGGKYALDYRFILDGNFYGKDWYWDADRRRWSLLQDICTIARNLGFDGINDADLRSEKWTPGEWREARFNGGILFAAKVYMNGNMHLKFNKELMGRLNVEAGRLLGWITSQKQADEEMGEHAARGAWGTAFALDMSCVKVLAA